MVHCTYEGVTGKNFKIKMYFSPEDVFILAKSVNPDEMLLSATFHLGFNCLPKYQLRVYHYTKGFFLW